MVEEVPNMDHHDIVQLLENRGIEQYKTATKDNHSDLKSITVIDGDLKEKAAAWSKDEML